MGSPLLCSKYEHCFFLHQHIFPRWKFPAFFLPLSSLSSLWFSLEFSQHRKVENIFSAFWFPFRIVEYFCLHFAPSSLLPNTQHGGFPCVMQSISDMGISYITNMKYYQARNPVVSYLCCLFFFGFLMKYNTFFLTF